MHVVGYVSSGERPRDDCDRPLRVVCESCGEADYWRCDSYGCGPCGEVKKRRLRRVIEDGSRGHVSSGLRGYFLTLTAPGTAEHLRWYQGKKPSRRSACSCHEHGQSKGRWNRQESACWNRLRTSLARDRVVHFAGSVETQKRGALHRHVVLFVEEYLDHQEVQELALAAGYGCVLDLEHLESPEKAARYLSKYVAKSASERHVVPWTAERVDTDTGEIYDVQVDPTYRLWSASRRWGVTMKDVRAAAGRQARQRAMYLRELLDALGDSEPPPERADSGAEGGRDGP